MTPPQLKASIFVPDASGFCFSVSLSATPRRRYARKVSARRPRLIKPQSSSTVSDRPPATKDANPINHPARLILWISNRLGWPAFFARHPPPPRVPLSADVKLWRRAPRPINGGAREQCDLQYPPPQLSVCPHCLVSGIVSSTWTRSRGVCVWSRTCAVYSGTDGPRKSAGGGIWGMRECTQHRVYSEVEVLSYTDGNTTRIPW